MYTYLLESQMQQLKQNYNDEFIRSNILLVVTSVPNHSIMCMRTLFEAWVVLDGKSVCYLNEDYSANLLAQSRVSERSTFA